ncbi:MAG: hypothetical protein U0457_02375 [Candidatus Sericytochromatia bacterium]
MGIKTLIISSCSGEKKFSAPNHALARDLDNIEKRVEKEEELKEFLLPAREMFISPQNKFIEESLKLFQQNNYHLDYYFISSGYGYISSNEQVMPYEVNLSVMPAYDNEKRGDFLKINQELSFSAKNYDLVFFLLSHEYIRTLNLPLELPEKTKQIFFLTKSDKKVINNIKNIIRLELGTEEINILNVKPSELKGYIFKLIAQESNNYDVLEEIYKNPEHIDQIILKNKKEKEIIFEQMSLFDNI